MELRRLAILAICGLLMAATWATSTVGQARISAAQAAAIAQERYSGSILDVEIDDAEPHERAVAVYEVRLITRDSVIIRIRIDAISGAFLEAAGDNLIPALKAPRR